MITPESEQARPCRTPTRRRFLCAAAAVGAGVAWAGLPSLTTVAAPAPAHAACGESVQDLLNLAYTIERAATTFYYTGLTSKAVMTNPRLAGVSGNPNAVARNGTPANVANLQAALDQEQKHARIFADLGARALATHYHFPAAAFESLGYTAAPGTFLWTLDHLETACIAVYLAAVQRFGELQRPELATLCVRNLAIECEHRALYRVIAHDDPADNITVPVVEFSCARGALGFFMPYLTGRGFPSGVTVTRALTFPTAAALARVIGKYTSN